jgi:ankyrin repeat protein
VSALPSSPDLAFERKQAKSLLSAWRRGDPAAIARVRAQSPRLADRPGRRPVLADAQFVIARERGLESWATLKAAIEAARPLTDHVTAFLAAIRDRRGAVARRLLASHPALETATIHTAAACGRVDVVGRLVAADPAARDRTDGREAWTPLAYACGSRLHERDAGRAAGLVATARTLLDAGADVVRASVYHEAHAAVPISALYHACMSDHLALVRLLLEHGAPTADGESIYHAAQYARLACLEAMHEHGADFSAAQAPYGNTPLYFLAGHGDEQAGQAPWLAGFRWLLAHGADPNVPSYASRETPLHAVARSGHLPLAAEALLAHGADPNRPRADGRTPFALAVRRGREAMIDLLRAHGGDPAAVSPIDELSGAILRGDGDAGRRLLDAVPPAERPPLLASLVGDAIRDGSLEALRVLHGLGADLIAGRHEGASALHWAAWHGRPALVDQLVAWGAAINERDDQFGSSPIAWAAHGSRYCHRADADYAAIVDRLAAAGAVLDAAINRSGEEPVAFATRPVAARLRAHGLVGQSPRRRP